MTCSLLDLVTVHVNDIKSTKDLAAFIAPFANEIANLLTITIFLPYLNFQLYPHHAFTTTQNMIKTIIDVLSLGGIIYNSVKETSETNDLNTGFIKGMLYLIFAFAVPNLFMRDILGNLPENNIIRMLGGLAFIYLLEMMINGLMCAYKKYKKD